MKTKIYYFSGTGNSLKIARDLCEKLEECELISIAKMFQKEHFILKSEIVGFIFPLYFFGLPKIVYDFINKIDVDEVNYIFAVITRGGDLDSWALYQIEELLKSKSKSLNAGFFMRMPANFYRNDPKALQDKIFKEKIKEIEKISKFIKNNEINYILDISEKKRVKFEKTIHKFYKTVHQSDKFFYVDENCSHCGICEKICPVKNIKLVEGIPQWQHQCQQCVACFNFCPEKSIQYGEMTLKRPRYHHPEIGIQDMIEQIN